MMSKDAMSQWLGIDVKDIKPGAVKCEMKVRSEMVNGFQIAHGGITYSLGDSALAFSVNSHGIHAVSVETSISHLKPVRISDVLSTRTTEISLSRKIGVYQVDIYNQEEVMVATFKGTVYRTGKTWELSE
ncbi:MAG: hotdog fold thioesterase [Crocinitomicaceae bacterium]